MNKLFTTALIIFCFLFHEDVEDFLSVVQNITFQPTESVACITVAIIDDSNPESPEPFAVTFEVPGDMGGVIIPPTTAMAEITIVDDDGGKSVEKIETILVATGMFLSYRFRMRYSC